MFGFSHSNHTSGSAHVFTNDGVLAWGLKLV